MTLTGLGFAVVFLVFLIFLLVAGAGMTGPGRAARRQENTSTTANRATPPEDLADDSMPSRSDDL